MSDEEERNRRLVRGVFRPLPTVGGGYGRHVLERAREQVRGQRAERPGWVLGVIAGALAVVIVVTLLVASGRVRLPAPSPGTTPLPSPTVSAPDPASQTVAYLSPDGQAGILVSWTGVVLQTFNVPGTDTQPAYASTDGRLLAVPDPQRPTTTIVNSSGDVVGSAPYSVGRWSKDGAHATCSLDVTAQGATVSVVDLSNPAQPRRTQHAVTGPAVLRAPSDGSQWYSIGCTVESDRVVAFHMSRSPGPSYGATEIIGVQLSTGRMLFDWKRQAEASPALSPDGRYLAENGGGGSTIREVPGGRIVGRVPGMVMAFSGDSRLVAMQEPRAVPPKLVAWRTGKTIWAASGTVAFLATRPGGGDMLVLSQGGRAVAIVDASGHVVPLPAPPADPHPHGVG